MPQSNKDRKAQQRQEYHKMFPRGKFQFNKGNGRFIRRKDESALGGKDLK